MGCDPERHIFLENPCEQGENFVIVLRPLDNIYRATNAPEMNRFTEGFHVL